jgi:hypothetical protein
MVFSDDRKYFFESEGREESEDPTSRDTRGKGSSSAQGEGNSSIFWDDNQGPVVMVWDGILPGEQESAKEIITDEDDWINWRVKPPRNDSGDRVGTDRKSQEITKGWYRTNGIRTMTCCRDEEIWVPKSGKRYSPERV